MRLPNMVRVVVQKVPQAMGNRALPPQRFFEYGIATIPGSAFSPAMEERVCVPKQRAGDRPILQRR